MITRGNKRERAGQVEKRGKRGEKAKKEETKQIEGKLKMGTSQL